MNFHEVGRLNYIEFLQYRYDAFIMHLNKTEKGQEYLKNAWRMEQTTPDRGALRRKIGKGGATGGR